MTKEKRHQHLLHYHKPFAFSFFCLLWIILLLTACQAAVFTPPRLATANAQKPVLPTSPAESVFVPVSTPTPSSSTGETLEPILTVGTNPTLTVWVNETSDEHEQTLTRMMAAFEETQQVSVELMLISPSLLPKLMETAILSDTLPDIVIHPASYTLGWATRGVFDLVATGEIIDQIGPESFNQSSLEMVTIDGLAAAIPTDGFQQLLIYRTDWLEDMGLPPPDDYDAMMNMAESAFDPENLITGIVIPTESNLVTTHQAFEHLAAANGCELIDDKGEVQILEPVCQEALDFYFSIVNQYSPVGVQTDTSAQNAYLAGRTAMIMSSPVMLAKLAGLDDGSLPTCPECVSEIDYLARNSGFLTQINGRGALSRSANYGEITNLGITRSANKEMAAAFADYWFNQGYPDWLGVEPERKVPMRLGTTAQPRQFIDAWGTQSLAQSDRSLTDIYGESIVAELRDNVANSSRWAFRQGQGHLITGLYEEFILPVVLQEMLSGYFNSRQTLLEMYLRITDLIPNYGYYRDPESFAEPEE